LPFDLKSFLAALPTKPGVYRMLDKNGEIIYVGKARHLRNRVSSYFHGRVHATRRWRCWRRWRASISRHRVGDRGAAARVQSHQAAQAAFNILLKDDKSFPFIHVSGHATADRVLSGYQKAAGAVLRPVSEFVATRETLLLLQKLFRLRPARTRSSRTVRARACSSRSTAARALCRPDHAEQYALDVADAVKVLDGRNVEVIEDLGRRMEAAARSSRMSRQRACATRSRC